MTYEFLMAFTHIHSLHILPITLTLTWGLYPRSWDHRSHALIHNHSHLCPSGAWVSTQTRAKAKALSFTQDIHTSTFNMVKYKSNTVQNNTSEIRVSNTDCAQLSNS